MRRDSKIVDIEPAFIQPADLLPKRIGAKAKSGERRSRDGVEKVAKEAACSASSSSKYSSKNLGETHHRGSGGEGGRRAEEKIQITHRIATVELC
jgi:hypothetical protein